jgi:hypothetical protein
VGVEVRLTKTGAEPLLELQPANSPTMTINKARTKVRKIRFGTIPFILAARLVKFRSWIAQTGYSVVAAMFKGWFLPKP